MCELSGNPCSSTKAAPLPGKSRTYRLPRSRCTRCSVKAGKFVLCESVMVLLLLCVGAILWACRAPHSSRNGSGGASSAACTCPKADSILKLGTRKARPRALDRDRRGVSRYADPHLAGFVCGDQTVANAHAA